VKEAGEKKLEKWQGLLLPFWEMLMIKLFMNIIKIVKRSIFPALEDFGLTVVEAQAFGKPVICFSPAEEHWKQSRKGRQGCFSIDKPKNR